MPPQSSPALPNDGLVRETGGRAVEPRPAAARGRYTLTALCYDLAGSTELLESLGIEDYQDAITTFQRLAQAAIIANAGEVVSDAGDGGLAIFSAHLDARDAASLAIRAGFDIISACKNANSGPGPAKLRVRIGIATAVTLVQTDQSMPKPVNITGPALAMATRLQSLAEPGTVLVSNETRVLAGRSHVFSDRGVLNIKGFSTPQQTWQAVRHQREVDRFFAFGRVSGPLIGRDSDLKILVGQWERATLGHGSSVLIEGEAGVGKSRLVHRLRGLTRSSRNKLLLFQCIPNASRSPLHPLLQRMQADGSGSNARRLASTVNRRFREQGITDPDIIAIFTFMLGLSQPDDPLAGEEPEAVRNRAADAVRLGIAQLCEAGPAIILVEDVHWIDPTTQSLLAEASRHIGQHPLLLVLTTRPGITAEWLDQKHLVRYSLRPLEPAGTQSTIVSRLSAAARALPEIVDLIARISAGNPLLIEEMCQWASENTQSARDALAQGVLPSATSAFERVIEARITSLGPASEIARAAAIAGARFDGKLLERVLPETSPATIASALERLHRAGLLVQFRPAGEPLYGFRHALIQDAIYAITLSRRRSAVHGTLFTALSADRSVAPWIETPLLAEHAERAGLREAAIETYIQAGRESAARSALTEARQLLQHAFDLTGSIDDPGRRDLLRLPVMAALGPVLTSMDGPSSEAAQTLYEDGVAIARRRPPHERAKWYPLYWGWWFTGSEINGDRAYALLEEMRDVEDPELQLQTRHSVWAIDFYLGRHDSCIDCVETGLPLYSAGGSPMQAMQYGGHDTKVCGLAHRGLSLWFKGKVEDAARSLRDARSWALRGGHAGSIVHALRNSAMFNCFRRDLGALRADIAEIRTLVQTHNLPSFAATADIFEGWCIGLEHDAARGRAIMEVGLSTHQSFQTPEDYPVHCGLLAEILVMTGDDAAALNLVDSAVKAAGETGHLYWIGQLLRYRARLLMRRNAPDDLIRDAVDIGLRYAAEQGALAILMPLRACAVETGAGAAFEQTYGKQFAALRAGADPDLLFHVHPEPGWMSGTDTVT